MQIPHDLAVHFPVPTLVIYGDHLRAQCYLVGNDAMEDLDGISVPRMYLTDRETAGGNGTGVAHPNEPHHAEQERQKRFVEQIAETIDDAIMSGSAERVFLALPPDIAHALRAALPTELNDKILREVHADVLKESPVDALHRFF